MAEYIEREEYCEKHCRCSNEYCDRESCPIWRAPTVDAVVVTRCKNCAHKERATVNEKGFLICPASGMEITPGDFCSYGEPKEGTHVDDHD